MSFFWVWYLDAELAGLLNPLSYYLVKAMLFLSRLLHIGLKMKPDYYIDVRLLRFSPECCDMSEIIEDCRKMEVKV